MDYSTLDLDSESLLGEQSGAQKNREQKVRDKKKSTKKSKVDFLTKYKKPLIIFGAFFVIVIVLLIYFLCFHRSSDNKSAEKSSTKYYSKLSGEEIADNSENDKPLFCMQIPNGMDVGDPRKQVGLHQAKVVFEAIAEAGITRFAAVFQNPQGSMLGPIRSMRSYYLAWDTPFDCTLVHAGGSADALQTIQAGRYQDLTEDYDYMWRDDSSYVAPNNLFTSPSLLNQFNNDRGYGASNFAAFPRLKPEEAKKEAEKLTQQEEVAQDTEDAQKAGSSEAPLASVNDIIVRFGGDAYFNPTYQYDANSNKYTRGWEYGATHTSYDCPVGLEQPTPSSQCTEVQLAPSVIAVMEVDQWLDTDDYHQVIQVTGSGTAYIFQNGTVIEGNWSKTNTSSQIEFKDKKGEVIKLAPGQLWIEAIPKHGGKVIY